MNYGLLLRVLESLREGGSPDGTGQHRGIEAWQHGVLHGGEVTYRHRQKSARQAAIPRAKIGGYFKWSLGFTQPAVVWSG
jgi:hypothetical protein